MPYVQNFSADNIHKFNKTSCPTLYSSPYIKLVNYSQKQWNIPFCLGEPEQDDRPHPTTILVEPFNENAPEFILFQCWHVQKAAAVS